MLTDHHNLKKFMETTRLKGLQIRWAQELSRYDFAIDYRQGKKNPADGLSRIPAYDGKDGADIDIEEDRHTLTLLQESLKAKDAKVFRAKFRNTSARSRHPFETECLQLLAAGTASIPEVVSRWAQVRLAIAEDDPFRPQAKDSSFNDRLSEVTREDEYV